MRITITTDASWKNDNFSYAFLISTPVGRFTGSGILRDCRTTTESELQAIGNALHYVFHNPDLWGVSKIHINSDCQGAIDMLKSHFGTPAMKRNGRYRKIVGKINNYKGEFRKKCGTFDWNIKHVKGHTDNPEARSKANRYVDQLAKDAFKI